jgi:hypothetical protein
MQENKRNVELAQYNTMLDFVSESQRAQPEFRQAHADLLRYRDETCKALREAEFRSQQLSILIFMNNWSILGVSATLDPHWYQSANVLSLDRYLISRTFGDHPVQDAGHFTDYLCKTIPPYLRESINLEDVPEHARDYKRCAKRAEILQKIFLLRKALLDSSDPLATRYGLYFSVFMITSILPRRTWDITWHPDRYNRGVMYWGPALHKSSKELFTFLDDTLTPPASDSDVWWTSPQPFFGAEAMYRELFSTYSSHSCEHREMDYDENDSVADYENYFLRDTNPNRCFHAHTVRLLRALYRHARKEVRVRTLLAAGQFLPVELTDLIVEHVLQVEGLADEDLIFDPERESLGGFLRPQYQCASMSWLPYDPNQRSNTAIRCDLSDYYH